MRLRCRPSRALFSPRGKPPGIAQSWELFSLHLLLPSYSAYTLLTLLLTLPPLLRRPKACSIDPVEVFSEVFQGSSRADINTHLEQRIAIPNRFTLNGHREFRLSPFFAKDERRDGVRTR